MADISLNRKHQLGLKNAKAAADKMSVKLNEKFALVCTWSGDTLNFQRPGVNGQMMVTETHMQLDVTLGFLLKAMKGPIEKSVIENLDNALASVKPAKPVSKTETAAKKPAPKKA